MSTQDTIESLRQKGFRITNIRRKLIEIFSTGKKPLSVQELIEKLAKSDITANKTTIYREVYFLLEQDILVEIDFGDRKKRYESAESEHHHHIICLKCSKVQDIHLESDLSEDQKKIEQETNFTITNHTLEFFGLCNTCHTTP
ncbi:MAG: Fur family transcriptional regulator [Candidatus Gracilibacteria bacterium]|nr:transcriptional repressor [Candidatus Peregrinibacteria bacterium]